MKAKELRIGNIIYWDIPEKIGINHKVISILENSINTIPISFSDNLKNYKPIPLTEDWLLKFGFVYNSSYEYWEKEGLDLTIRQNYKINISKMMYSLFCEDVSICIIYHVHQLQNLYFALTGEELIKRK